MVEESFPYIHSSFTHLAFVSDLLSECAAQHFGESCGPQGSPSLDGISVLLEGLVWPWAADLCYIHHLYWNYIP